MGSSVVESDLSSPHTLLKCAIDVASSVAD